MVFESGTHFPYGELVALGRRLAASGLLKEWEFAEFTSAASGERHGKNASRSTHPERIWSAEDEWVKDLCLGGQGGGVGRGQALGLLPYHLTP